MAICKGGYVKMEEVAVQINRSIDYLKNRIFPDIYEMGSLLENILLRRIILNKLIKQKKIDYILNIMSKL